MTAMEVCEAVGAFDDPQALERAVQDLLTSGFDHEDLSVLAGDGVVRKKLGHLYTSTIQAADDPQVPRTGYAEPESRTEGRGALAGMLGYVGAVIAGGLTVATGGAAAAVIAAGVLAGGAGTAVGLGLGRIMDQRIAAALHQQLERGGILLWVRAPTAESRDIATSLLAKHGAHHIHVHTVPAG
ncbi:MAG: general stress protein [Rhodospirillales bacterium]|nr:general stress protein [Rhodospirillales bacterium]